MDVALEMEKEVGETSLAIQLRRVAKLFNIELQNGMPAALYRLDGKKLEELLIPFVSIGWPMTAFGFRQLKKNLESSMRNDVMIPVGPDFLPMKPTISKLFWVCLNRVVWKLSKGRFNSVYMPASTNRK